MEGGGGVIYLSLRPKAQKESEVEPAFTVQSFQRERETGEGMPGDLEEKAESRRGEREERNSRWSGKVCSHSPPPSQGCSLLPSLAGLLAPSQDPLRWLSPPTSTHQVGVL